MSITFTPRSFAGVGALSAVATKTRLCGWCRGPLVIDKDEAANSFKSRRYHKKPAPCAGLAAAAGRAAGRRPTIHGPMWSQMFRPPGMVRLGGHGALTTPCVLASSDALIVGPLPPAPPPPSKYGLVWFVPFGKDIVAKMSFHSTLAEAENAAGELPYHCRPLVIEGSRVRTRVSERDRLACMRELLLSVRRNTVPAEPEPVDFDDWEPPIQVQKMVAAR
jgi:hypothetical protein